jgi:hypothetical protein
MTPIANYPSLAALCLLRQIFQVKRTEQSFNTDVNFLGFAILDRAYLDLAEAQTLMDTGKVLLVTRNAVKSLSYDNIELGGASIPHESLPSQAVRHRGTRYGTILTPTTDK